MTLAKTTILTGISTLIKLSVAFAINKIIAVNAGPAGLAIIGQLQNFISISTIASNGAITNGVIKYTAEYTQETEKQHLFSTALKISVLSAIFVSVIIFIFSTQISMKLFGTQDYKNILYIFSFTIIFYSLNTLFLSILNGQKEINKYVFANIANSIFSLLIVGVLTVNYGLKGALYALVTTQSVVFFITLFFIVKSNWFTLAYFTQRFNTIEAKKLSHFSLMGIVSIISALGSILVVRYYIGINLSWVEAGYWQGIIYISDAYLMLITLTLSVYYLPKFSEIQDKNKLKREIINSYKWIIPIVSSMAIVIFMLKVIIIELLFSKDFYPMVTLFKWQLIGDVIKMSSWVLGYLLIAKSLTKLFVSTEIIFSISFVMLAILFINLYGLIGVTYAFSLNYLLYFLTMLYITTTKVL